MSSSPSNLDKKQESQLRKLAKEHYRKLRSKGMPKVQAAMEAMRIVRAQYRNLKAKLKQQQLAEDFEKTQSEEMEDRKPMD